LLLPPLLDLAKEKEKGCVHKKFNQKAKGITMRIVIGASLCTQTGTYLDAADILIVYKKEFKLYNKY